MGNLDFNTAETAAKNMDFDPLPPGRYKAQVTNSEVVPTKAGTGELLKLTFEILEGAHAGRLVFDQLNIANQSEKAEQIGRGMLSALCQACGKNGMVSDSIELHEIPIQIKLGIDSSPGYEPRNKVKGFYAADYVGRKAPEKAEKAEKTEAVDAESDDLPF